MLNNNTDAFRLSILDDLSFLNSYITEDFTLTYDKKDYQSTKDTLYFKNVCDLISSVRT